jgi:hypothetical protein
MRLVTGAILATVLASAAHSEEKTFRCSRIIHAPATGALSVVTVQVDAHDLREALDTCASRLDLLPPAKAITDKRRVIVMTHRGPIILSTLYYPSSG